MENLFSDGQKDEDPVRAEQVEQVERIEHYKYVSNEELAKRIVVIAGTIGNSPVLYLSRGQMDAAHVSYSMSFEMEEHIYMFEFITRQQRADLLQDLDTKRRFVTNALVEEETRSLRFPIALIIDDGYEDFNNLRKKYGIICTVDYLMRIPYEFKRTYVYKGVYIRVEKIRRAV
jgi:hypothetical protein